MAETVNLFLLSLIVTDLTITELEMLINSKLLQLNNLSHCVCIIRELILSQFTQAKKLTTKFKTYF